MAFVYPSRKHIYSNSFISGQYPRVLGNENKLQTLNSINSAGNEAIRKGFNVTAGPLISKDLQRKVESEVVQQQPQLLATFLPITKSKTDGAVVQPPPAQGQGMDKEKEKEKEEAENKKLESERSIRDKVMLKETSKILNKLKKESNKKPTKAEKKRGSGLIKI